ncbi:hypothetical protein NLO88_18505 [Pseudomonas syringae]|nr:hypothetical protein [Pseudomonas syringae]
MDQFAPAIPCLLLRGKDLYFWMLERLLNYNAFQGRVLKRKDIMDGIFYKQLLIVSRMNGVSLLKLCQPRRIIYPMNLVLLETKSNKWMAAQSLVVWPAELDFFYQGKMDQNYFLPIGAVQPE